MVSITYSREATTMKLHAILLTCIMAINTSSSSWTAGELSIKGLWRTQKDDKNAEIMIDKCTDKPETLCGKIVWLQHPIDDRGQLKTDRNNPDDSLKSRPIMGLHLLHHFMKKDDELVWAGGTIYNPENGKTYSCTLTLMQDDNHKEVLEIHGYVGVEILGESQYLTRVTQTH